MKELERKTILIADALEWIYHYMYEEKNPKLAHEKLNDLYVLTQQLRNENKC